MPSSELPSSHLPRLIIDGSPDLVELYDCAWQQAWIHVTEKTGAPQSPYMDEAHSPDLIWIWDTCFMALFCKYAPMVFPGVESLQNFYQPIHDGTTTTLEIHHLDNPPLFAWVEWVNYQFTGRREHLTEVYHKGYLQKHYNLIEQLPLDGPLPASTNETFLRRVPMGYHWAGCPSGMDNTPRGGGGAAPGPMSDDSRHGYPDILWLDALAQQALAAEHIVKVAQLEGDIVTARQFQSRYDEVAELLNARYWDETDGTYYDIYAKPPHSHYKVLTPASFWPMLAGVCTQRQAERLVEHAMAPETLGGLVPFPSVARSDPAFDPLGGYWRGGIWLPTAYMAIKAMERYGFLGEARKYAERLVQHMADTFRHFEPATIWEAYSPTESKPSTNKTGGIVRPNFCGWSALGPISLTIENIIGLHKVEARARRVHWDRRREDRHGLENLRFGDVCCDLVYDEGKIRVSSNRPLQLVVNNKTHMLPAGASTLQSP